MIAISLVFILFFFFFNDTATTEIYTLSLHDALPIYQPMVRAYLIPQAIKGGKHGGAQYMECDQLPRKRRVSGAVYFGKPDGVFQGYPHPVGGFYQQRRAASLCSRCAGQRPPPACSLL